MPRYCPRCGETLHSDGGTTKGQPRKTARRAYEPTKKTKIKRKPSAYNKRYKAEYARQKKKHPRSAFAALAKRTHRALRRGK